MTEQELDKVFDAAFERASKTKIKLPPDLMLHFYAYYKRATLGRPYHNPSGENELRNAFKINALFQVQNLTQTEAKLKYIELVNKYITD
ncbi:MAG: acyl-CoA-binding protein [Flavobacteriaceae bacterium]|nr:acyl-CoA-binding protein [Bacteroidota bacterium]MDT8414127.1 acyl-CoA-binding protein [Flavobacteriaceae bacterium]